MSNGPNVDPVAHLAAIVEFSDDAIVSKTLDGIITTWNRGAERLFGYRPEEAVGQSIRLIIPKERWPEEDAVLARVCRGEVVDHFETVRQRRDGSQMAISLTVSPIKDAAGRIVGASKIARDISQRREIEVERARLLAEAEAANQAKDQFLAVLSHELRTPLNAILGWAEVLKQPASDAGNWRRGLDAISRNVKAQAKLIDDLLDISRIAAGKMRLEVQPVDLAPIIESALETVTPAARAKRIEVRRSLAPGAVVLGDAGRLQQTIWNLLSNAVKFTPAGGWVEVKLAVADSRVEVTVADNGMGIGSEYLPYAFNRFSQADSSMRRPFGGLGLGLAIARELVQLHGGTIAVESAGAGQGSTFALRLPRSVISAWSGTDEGGAMGAALPSLAGLRILVVDDDDGSREVTEAVLASTGAAVRLAASAAAAREELVLFRPQVLVADLGMPGEDGYSLIRSVRRLPSAAGGAVPALALTALARPEDREHAIAAGFQSHLAKPAEPRQLIRMVARLAGLVAGPGSSAGTGTDGKTSPAPAA